ncbi:MAG: DMT family transporter [Alphaproteobacteria bacterium]|nr:DMT family transporter [Alphaproteobacteria bacterium]
MSANVKAAFLALLAFAVFATHDVIIKFLGASFGPVQIVFFSVLFGFPWLTLMLVRDEAAENLRPHHPWWVTIRTIAVIFSSFCAFYAFSNLPLAQVYTIIFMMPLFITLLSIPFLGERVGFHRGASILAGLAGVIIVLRPGSAELGLGHLAALGTAFGGALASVIVRKIGQEERGAVFLLYPMLGNIALMGALLPFSYQPMSLTEMGLMALLAAFAFLATALMIGAYKIGEAAAVAPMQYSQMIWAIIFGALLFGETPDVMTMIGALVIIASGIYIVVRESTSNISQNQPVLRSRSRVAAGSYFRIGPMIRKSRMKRNASKPKEDN